MHYRLCRQAHSISNSAKHQADNGSDQTCVRVQQLSQLIAYDAGWLSLSNDRETQQSSNQNQTSRRDNVTPLHKEKQEILIIQHLRKQLRCRQVMPKHQRTPTP
jgi:hypothetical protein